MASETDHAAGSDVEEEEKYVRPPSSYGSMKSEDESAGGMEDEEGEEEEEGGGGGEPVVFAQPDPPAPPVLGSQMMHSVYTETILTDFTEQTKPPDAMVIDTGSVDVGSLTDDELDDDDEVLLTCSPEPPEPLEMEGWNEADENSQPGRLHPELDLPHIFKTILNVVVRLNDQELFKFKLWYNRWDQISLLEQTKDGDVLDFVDKAIEVYGPYKALSKAISTLESMEKEEEMRELMTKGHKALFRFHLKEYYIRKFVVIREGVVQAGKSNILNDVYVEPQISTCGFGGVDPTHEFLAQPPTPVQVPTEDTFVALNDLFRLKKADGSPVRTVVTTGIPGVGMSVSVAKFSLDWADDCANRDLQYVLKLSFRALRLYRDREDSGKEYSIFDVLGYYHYPKEYHKLLEEEDARFLIIMDCMDSYMGPLDWENAPVITDNNTKAHMNVLVVNLIRGTLLRGARIWILGRRAAVSQIPSKYIDVITELQGFNEAMRDDYLTKRFTNAQLAEKIVRHYKRVPMIQILTRNPFYSWMVAKVFGDNYRNPNYGTKRPRLTPFHIHFLIIQTNRSLKFYYNRTLDMKWREKERQFLRNLAKLAFKMLQANTSVFFEEDLKELELDLTQVVMFSGLCTELPPKASSAKRTFCFSNFTLQEFMAALYVFLIFYVDAKNILDSKWMKFTSPSRSAVGLVQSAWTLTLSSKLGHYDMFLRYLCGLLSPYCHYELLKGFLYSHTNPKVEALTEAEQLLDKISQSAPEDRKRNLYECIREMTQEQD
ncbi:NLR family CARD domain-containing protein 3 [Cyprinodon tularosa]|uniref:NLR family CARD domain-containing protein 3 n=1 Tax=Cyprinodon tularosa TaxID=77115 RepID=UPI0018E1E474|nr:NLR family CARD domain-containing protein 3 [Cyprinodon tularosa]